jgi:uncharacterized SAM-binding protein YcdF (DUF218 family)
MGELKPYLTTLAMPPTLLLLGILAGLVWSFKRPHAGRTLVLICTASLWLLATPVFSVWLSRHALPVYAPAKPQALKPSGVQAIVVLGGGVETDLPDGIQQLKKGGLDRLRHGITLARQSGLPLMVAGGKGWGASGQAESEADVSRRVAQEAFGMALRWTDANSRDTHENARNARQLLASEGIERIALVTHSWHMPRSVRSFEKAGLVVTPAPMGYPTLSAASALNWLPSANALATSYNVLREWLALRIQQG